MIKQSGQKRNRVCLTIGFMGIDGTGKTTQAKLLQQALQEKDINSSYFHLFSTQTKIASKATSNSIAGLWLNRMDSLSGTNAVAIAELMIRIPSLILESWIIKNPCESATEVVIYDRYFYDKIISTMYSYARNLNFGTKKIIIFAARLVRKPDIIIGFQLAPEAAIKRKKEHLLGEAKQICELYSRLHQILSVTPINAERKIEDINLEIQKRVLQTLKGSESK